MTNEEIKSRITWLQEQVLKYNDAYYKKAQPLVPDRVYDDMIAELHQLQEDHSDLLPRTGPAYVPGSDLTKGFLQVKHEIPMLSLENTYSSDDLVRYVETVSKEFDKTFPECVVECKIDGLSISCIYEYGRLVRAVTRGDGMVGDDVTRNVMKIPDIPKLLHHPGHMPTFLEIRGEVFMTFEDFHHINEKRTKNNLPPLANPRNAAAGTLKSLDPAVLDERPLHAFFYATGAIYPELEIKTQIEMYELFDSMRIPYEPVKIAVFDRVSLMPAIRKIEEYRKVAKYPIDGAVVKLNQFSQRKALGETSKYPRWARAYKFEQETAETILRGITLQVGRTGVITPVAELDPVELGGSVIRRTTLHNEDYIQFMKLRIGDLVSIQKAGEVIPEIVRSVSHAKDSKEWSFEEATRGKCPSCGRPIRRRAYDSDWKCRNIECPARIVQSIVHMASRNALDITGIGYVTAEALVRNRLVSKLTDLFKLDWENLGPMSVGDPNENRTLGEANAKKIAAAIQEAKKKPFSNWLYAFGVDTVGLTTAKTLAREYGSLSKLLKYCVPDYSIVRSSLADFVQHEPGNSMIRELLDMGIDPVDTPSDLPMSGKKVAFTGTFQKMRRSDLMEKARLSGADPVLSVTKDTAFLVAGVFPPGPTHEKVLQARKYNIPIITEEAFLTMCAS